MPPHPFQSRIEYQHDIVPLLEQICQDYNFGTYKSHSVVPVGYEDFNIILITDQDKYFLKIFAQTRTYQNCQRYLHTMFLALQAGVKHPKIYHSNQGPLYETMIGEATIRLCVLQFIHGKTLYELKTPPTTDQLKFIAQQAALINQLPIKPNPVYDDWAVINFLTEFDRRSPHISPEDHQLILPLVDKFRVVDILKLPHCFVHGDIIRTNVIVDDAGQLYLLDFSVANSYPRIQELAILFCDLFFNENQPESFPKLYELGLTEYQSHIPLTPKELDLLPLFIKVAHAMHILCSSFERDVNKNKTPENDLWLTLGRTGLAYTSKLWKA